MSSSTSPKILIVVDTVRTASPEFFGCLSGWQWESLRGKLLRAGLNLDDVDVALDADPFSALAYKVVVGLGEGPLRAFTGKSGVDKWVLSPLPLGDGRIFIPTYDLGRTQKQYELNLYQEMAFRRAYEMTTLPIPTTAERFLLNPPLEETLETLRRIKHEPELAVDVETGYGQINTVGFAWSPHDAIAINVLPDRLSDQSYYELWRGITDVLEGPSLKVFQNFIYDVSYFSAYGIRVRGQIFDTMWAMKFLWPEFKSNLGNVGRFYTKRVYWKDDGKVTDEEGSKKNWGDVRDWLRHYTYNCRDTSGTLEASRAQREDLRNRGLDQMFGSYILRLVEPIREMCRNGMPLSLTLRDELKASGEKTLEELTQAFKEKAGEVNPRSPKQVLNYLREQGIKLPKKFDKKTGAYKESTDAASIKKILLKSPDTPGLRELQQIKTLDKALSSYVNFDVRPDGRLSYSLNGCGTETLRFSGNKDPWDRGFNIQTIPREGGVISVKSMFVAPEGQVFGEVDLSQAESRYVAYASVCKKLIDMLESGDDIHKYVAHEILRALRLGPEEYAKKWRNLGKKTGHGANYMMKEGTFVENVFKDMDLVLSKNEGKLMLDSYFHAFPEIRRWHGEIKRELYQKRKLVAPTGWERYFYGRPDDNTLREAVAWAPQHTIPWITNHLMLHLCDERKHGKLKFRLIYQGHDALVFLASEGEVGAVLDECFRLERWHPEVILPGGKLIIPIEAKTGKCLADLKDYHAV